MDRVYLSWTIENWITVVLMAAAGYFVMALVASVIHKRAAMGSAPVATSPAAAQGYGM